MGTDLHETQLDKDLRNEPETRAKRVVNRSVAQKFNDVLRQSQQIQSDYKLQVQGALKRHLRMAIGDVGEE